MSSSLVLSRTYMPLLPVWQMALGLRTILERVSRGRPSLSINLLICSGVVLITRGLAEMTRIGTTYGASPLTFLSLAGVGDLFLTCSSPTSRNYTVGYRLGKGEKLDYIIDTLGSVAEGVTTAKALHTLISGLGVNAPIATGVSDVDSPPDYLDETVLYRFMRCSTKVSSYPMYLCLRR